MLPPTQRQRTSPSLPRPQEPPSDSSLPQPVSSIPHGLPPMSSLLPEDLGRNHIAEMPPITMILLQHWGDVWQHGRVVRSSAQHRARYPNSSKSFLIPLQPSYEVSKTSTIVCNKGS